MDNIEQEESIARQQIIREQQRLWSGEITDAEYEERYESIRQNMQLINE